MAKCRDLCNYTSEFNRSQQYSSVFFVNKTYIGHVLISVNPFKDLGIYTDDVLASYKGKNLLEVKIKKKNSPMYGAYSCLLYIDASSCFCYC